jgi:hypothetical protein
MRFSTRHVRTLLAATTLVAGLGAPADAACAGVRTVGRWTTADYPKFPDLTSLSPHNTWNPSFVGKYYAAGTTRREVYVTDGVVVFRTADGGCTWQTAFDTNPASTTDVASDVWADVARAHAGYQVTDIGSAGSRTTMLALQNGGSLVWALDSRSTPVLVAATTDAAKTWRVTPIQAACVAPGTPAVPIMSISSFVVADDTHAYATTQISLDTFMLYTADAGRSWACHKLPSKAVPNYAANRLRPAEVWTVGCDGMYRSTDGGAHWAPRGKPWAADVKGDQVFCQFGEVDVRAARGGATDVLVHVSVCDASNKACSRHVYVTANGGTTWKGLASPLARPGWEALVGVRWGAARGSMVSLVAVGVQSISPPSGYVVRAWPPGGKRWADRGGMTDAIDRGCAHPSLSSVVDFRPTDATRAEFAAHGDVYYGNDSCYVLLRYKAT